NHLVAVPGVLASIAPLHENPRLAQKCRLPEEFRARSLGHIVIDLFQVPGSVVAGYAGEVQSQEDPSGIDIEIIDRVQTIADAVIIGSCRQDVGVIAVAADQVRRWNGAVALGRRDEEIMNDVIVRTIRAQPLLVPEVKQVALVAVSAPAQHTKQIAPQPAPLFGAFLGADQGIDQEVALLRIPVRKKSANRLGGRELSGCIDVDAANEFFIAAHRRMRNAVALHASEEMLIDQVFTFDLRPPAGTRQPSRYAIGESRGFALRFRLRPEQLSVRVLDHLLGLLLFFLIAVTGSLSGYIGSHQAGESDQPHERLDQGLHHSPPVKACRNCWLLRTYCQVNWQR